MARELMVAEAAPEPVREQAASARRWHRMADAVASRRRLTLAFAATAVPNQARLLGFAPVHGLAGLLAALRAGDPVGAANVEIEVVQGPGLAALLQREPATKITGRGRAELLGGLHLVQRRLEIACQAGPFLPMDPAAASCAVAALPRLMATAWDAIGVALARHGRRHQWDVVLRWPPQTVVARRGGEIQRAAATAGGGRGGLAEAVAQVLRADRADREAALIAALKPAALAFAPGGPSGDDGMVALTVLLPADGEAAIEVALAGLAPDAAADATVDLKGPLPPVSFAAARLVEVQASAIAAAWRLLELPLRIDRVGLHRHWRLRAFALHPDRNEGDAAATALADTTRAYHLLRDLGRDDAVATWDMQDMLGRAGIRLVLPPDAAS